MKTDHAAPLVSQCRVERGLYLLRYVEAAGYPHPRAEIAFGVDQLRVINAPGREGAILSDPGQVLVIIAQEACQFEMRVLAVGGGNTDAQFGLDLLDAGRPQQSWASEYDQRRPMEPASQIVTPRRHAFESSELSVLAHVSRRGDVRAGADTWISGPSEVLPIEGLAISTGRQELGARIRVQTTRGGQQWSRWHEPGEFAGSRQKADALTGIGMALTGAEASRFEISAEIIALGSPLQVKSGQEVEFFGPDPIVGFRLRLNPVNATSSGALGSPRGALRVFRASR